MGWQTEIPYVNFLFFLYHRHHWWVHPYSVTPPSFFQTYLIMELVEVDFYNRIQRTGPAVWACGRRALHFI